MFTAAVYFAPKLPTSPFSDVMALPYHIYVLATEGTAKRIIFGWAFGLVGCVTGIETSLRLDWSPGPTIVAVFLVLLVLTWLTKKLIPKGELVN